VAHYVRFFAESEFVRIVERARIKDRASHREFIEYHIERGISSAPRKAPRQPRAAAGYNETTPRGIQMLIRNSFRVGGRLNKHESWQRSFADTALMIAKNFANRADRSVLRSFLK